MRINKYTTLWWVVILLLTLNVVTIGTIIYRSYHPLAPPTITIEQDTPPLNGAFFRNELHFDDSQMALFKSENQKFKAKAVVTVGEIERLKQDMFKVLDSDEPDEAKIRSIAEEIGKQHRKLKIETAQFYLTLKQMCRPDQQDKLSTVFRPLFKACPAAGSKGCCRMKKN